MRATWKKFLQILKKKIFAEIDPQIENLGKILTKQQIYQIKNAVEKSIQKENKFEKLAGNILRIFENKEEMNNQNLKNYLEFFFKNLDGNKIQEMNFEELVEHSEKQKIAEIAEKFENKKNYYENFEKQNFKKEIAKLQNFCEIFGDEKKVAEIEKEILKICEKSNSIETEIKNILKKFVHRARRDFLENAAFVRDVQNQIENPQGTINSNKKEIIDLNFVT